MKRGGGRGEREGEIARGREYEGESAREWVWGEVKCVGGGEMFPEREREREEAGEGSRGPPHRRTAPISELSGPTRTTSTGQGWYWGAYLPGNAAVLIIGVIAI